jgi:hypothetical protein
LEKICHVRFPRSLPSLVTAHHRTKPARGHFEETCRLLKKRADICKNMRAFEKINPDAVVTSRNGDQPQHLADAAG